MGIISLTMVNEAINMDGMDHPRIGESEKGRGSRGEEGKKKAVRRVKWLIFRAG